MRISELSRRTGVSVHRLRRYEAEGLVAAERGASNYREFADRTVREVVFIAMGRDLGFSLEELGEALPRYRAGTLTIDEMLDRLRERIAQVEALITQQTELRQRLDDHADWLQKRRAPDRPPVRVTPEAACPLGGRAAHPAPRSEALPRAPTPPRPAPSRAAPSTSKGPQ